MDNYLKILEESLRKKLRVLDEIQSYNEKQKQIFQSDSVEMDAFDAAVEEKGKLIEQISKLDEGFEALYSNVSKELDGNREKYAKQIDSAVFPGMQGGPLMHIIASKAVCLKEALSPEFKEYQDQVIKNAKALADRLSENGFRLISGGTDNHLMLVDVMTFGKNGKEVQNLLEGANITLNKNTTK